jgi:hypothetical protein
MKKAHFAAILAALLFATFTLAVQSPREAFKELVAQLQQNSGDDTLREKVIQAAAALDPAPAIPEDARRNLIEGMTLHTDAKTPEDEKIAFDSFSKALQLAPWWGDVYLAQSVSQELAGQLDAAEKSLHFYLLSNPGEEKARTAQDHIYVLGAKRKKVHAAVQASQQQIDQRKNLSGWWQCKAGCGGFNYVQSDGADIKAYVSPWTFDGHFELDAVTGLASLGSYADPANPACAIPEQKHRMTAFLEENGTLIRLKYELTIYQSRSHVQPDPIFGYLSPTTICDGVSPVSTNPQEIVLAGGTKQAHFGVAMTTITPDVKGQPTDPIAEKAIKDGYHDCNKKQQVNTAGILILSVEPSSAAALGGLKTGDIINVQSHLNGRSGPMYCSAAELSNNLKNFPPGQHFAIEVFDGSKHPQIHEFTMGSVSNGNQLAADGGNTSATNPPQN